MIGDPGQLSGTSGFRILVAPAAIPEPASLLLVSLSLLSIGALNRDVRSALRRSLLQAAHEGISRETKGARNR